MDRNDFSEDAPGRLVRTIGDGWSFVPNPLPPQLDWDDTLALDVSRAERALGRLDGAGSQLPNPHLLIAPFVRREAVLSSRIEGTQTLLPDLLRFDVEPEIERDKPDVRGVANYVAALEHGLSRLREFPLSLRLIREMHEKLMSGVRGDRCAPGQFRRTQNLIGPPGCKTAQDARFVPPPPSELDQALGDFETYLHAPSTRPALVDLALLHYQFEAIHPFIDGNGRVGRLLIAVWFCARELLHQPLLYLSAYFEGRREEYYDLLLGVSLHGRWSDWVHFFLEGVVEQATDGLKRSADLLSLRETFRHRLQTPRGSARALELVDHLFQSPYVTIAGVQRFLNVSFPGAQGIVGKLQSAGILEEATGRNRPRVFVASEVLRALE